MKVSAIRLATGCAVALAVVFVSAAPAFAESRGFPCGKVTAYTPPTATTAGSIRIGTTTFVATAGSLPNPPPPIAVGSIVCLTGRLDATGAFTSLTTATLAEQVVCGTVQAFAPASATTPGSVTILSNASWTLPVRAGVALSAAQATGAQCFKFDVNADGNAEVVRYSGPGTPAPVGQLPNTSTRNSSEAALAILGLAGVFLVALRVFTIRRPTGPSRWRWPIPSATLGVLMRLHDIGVRLAIDDFGTGQSSLAYMRRLPVQILKIDRSFITGLVEDDTSASIVKATIDVGHALGLTVVAEGVEDERPCGPWLARDASGAVSARSRSR